MEGIQELPPPPPPTPPHSWKYWVATAGSVIVLAAGFFCLIGIPYLAASGKIALSGYTLFPVALAGVVIIAISICLFALTQKIDPPPVNP